MTQSTPADTGTALAAARRGNLDALGLVFKALSSPQRLRLLILLRHEPRTERDLCAALDLGTIEAHLQTLLQAGFIVRHKNGVAPTTYTLAEGALDQLTQVLEKFRA